MTMPDGCIDTGQWREGILIAGARKCPNGTQFLGTYENGCPGRGKMTWKDGHIFEGEFRGCRYYRGSMEYPGGYSKSGTWESVNDWPVPLNK